MQLSCRRKFVEVYLTPLHGMRNLPASHILSHNRYVSCVFIWMKIITVIKLVAESN